MRIGIELNLHYRFMQTNTVSLVIEAARSHGQTIHDEVLLMDDPQLTRIAGDAGVGTRLWAPLNYPEMALQYRATVQIDRPVPDLHNLPGAPMSSIPAEAAPYLRPSRYCESDKLAGFVGERFGHVSGGAQVAAMANWIRSELSYVPGSSNTDTTALETFGMRMGVCRDYMHLLCAMCRATGIPARAVAAYGPDVQPPDMHAVVEVWLDGAWHIVDPSGMCTPDSIVVIAVGRDANDIAFMESQAPAEMLSQWVSVVRV